MSDNINTLTDDVLRFIARGHLPAVIRVIDTIFAMGTEIEEQDVHE
jgi:hypothetical protein